jgi:phosphatidylinositol-3-phosphatase
VSSRPACLVVAFALTAVAGCGGGPSGGSAAPRSKVVVTTSTTRPAPTTSSAAPSHPDLAEFPCQGLAASATYQHVVVVMMENRTWNQVGGVGFGAMNYLASLAKRCAFYAKWTDTNPAQDSLTQYIGLTSGVDNPRTVNDCSPSGACSSSDNNIFRQVRESGGTARSYVEGASEPCSASGNAAKHIPALYYRGVYQDTTGTHNDADFCKTEVRPANELDPNNLPTFAILTPDLCHDGHDCLNSTVDDWARVRIGAILAGDGYRAGNTAVFVLWDESDPVPNLLIAPSAQAGPRDGAGSHAAALKTIEELLGLAVLAQGQLPAAPDLRASAPI